MKFLILDKVQRLKNSNDSTYANTRIKEELDLINADSYFAFLNQIKIEKNSIYINNENIKNFTHIIFRGHDLGDEKQYQTKRDIAHYIDQYNTNNPDKKIFLQNIDTLIMLEKYDKIYLHDLCTKLGVPTIPSFYKSDGIYSSTPFGYPYILKIISGKNEILTINGKEKIKKNVFLIEKEEDLNQERLNGKDLKEFFAQEYLKSGEDFRIFVSNGEPVGGFSRKSTSSFITVKSGEYNSVDFTKEKDIYSLAKKFATILKSNFIAVDIMRDNNGKAVIQEISLNPGFKAYETKLINGKPINLAKTIINSF